MPTPRLAPLLCWSALFAWMEPAAAQQSFGFRGQLVPSGQVNFNDPYRLARPTLRYDVELDLTVSGGRIGGTARIRAGAEEGSFPVQGRVKVLGCDFRAGNVLRFQGLCASEMIVGDAMIGGGQAPAQFNGRAPRGSWLAATSGLTADAAVASRASDIRCQLPPLTLSQPQPALAQAQTEVMAAANALRQDQAALAARAERARTERDRALAAIELSGGELMQAYRANLNFNRLLSRGSPAIWQMAQNRAFQMGQIENQPGRVAANRALGPAVQELRAVAAPGEQARLDQGARAVADAFRRWDGQAAAIAAALPATAAGVADALTLEAATPWARSCAVSLSAIADGPPALPKALAARAPSLAPAVVAAIQAASTSARSSIELQTRLGQLRQGSLFRDLPGIAPALAKGDAQVAALERSEAAERARRAQQQAAARAERRRKGLLTDEDVREAVLAEIVATEPNTEVRGDTAVRTEFGFPAMLYRPVVSGTSCRPAGGTSTCSYELRIAQSFIGLPVPYRTETRTDTIALSPGGLRSPTLNAEFRARAARQAAAAARYEAPKPSWEPPNQLPFDLIIQRASPF